MKYLCDGCSRLVDLLAFEVAEERLEVVCPACGAKSQGGVALAAPLPRPQPARTSAPPPQCALDSPQARVPASWPRPLICPKCAAARSPGRADCTRCGLVFDRFNPEDFALPEAIEALWTSLDGQWSDPASHDRFIESCSAADLLTEAVRRYRVKSEQDPTDAVAQRYRDQLIEQLMAAAALPRRSEDPGARTRRVNLVVAGLLMLGVTALALLFIFQRLAAPGP